MTVQVKLEDIIEGMEMQFEGTRTLLNIKTGKVISVSDDDLRAAEDEEPFDHLPEWQQKEMRIAYDVVDHFENYQDLPTKFEINEYEMMEDFIFSIQDRSKKDMLLREISGRGAFRRFKGGIIRLGIEDQWYSYRDDCYKQIAIKFCKRHNLGYV